MAYRKKYRRQTFAQKVKSNKSLKWFKDQKIRIDTEISNESHKLSKLDQFTELFLPDAIVKHAQAEKERHIKARRYHQNFRPTGFIDKLFNHEHVVSWEEEDKRLAQLVENKTIRVTSEMQSFIKREGLADSFRFYDRSLTSVEEIQRQLDRARALKKLRIQQLSEQLKMLEPKLREMHRKEELRQREKSVIARVRKQSRDNAARIKVKLEKTHNCPYCEKTLGPSPHADHIYPLSRGGQETESNMVYVCAECNISKSDKTLHNFCAERGLDFTKISHRLRSMGKDF